jgi:hypothetical protein
MRVSPDRRTSYCSGTGPGRASKGAYRRTRPVEIPARGPTPECNRGDPPSHWLAHERFTIQMHEALCSQETRPHRQIRSSASPKRGGMTHVVPSRGSRLLRTFGRAAPVHGCASATLEGLARSRACWAAGQIGNRPTPVKGCPQGMGGHRSGEPWPLTLSYVATARNATSMRASC